MLHSPLQPLCALPAAPSLSEDTQSRIVGSILYRRLTTAGVQQQ